MQCPIAMHGPQNQTTLLHTFLAQFVSVCGGERGKTLRASRPMRRRAQKSKRKTDLWRIRTVDRWFRRPVRFHCAKRPVPCLAAITAFCMERNIRLCQHNRSVIPVSLSDATEPAATNRMCGSEVLFFFSMQTVDTYGMWIRSVSTHNH